MEKIYLGITNYASASTLELMQVASLDAGELARLERLRPPLVKAAFLAGRALVRGMVGRTRHLAPADLDFKLLPSGKPVFAKHPDIIFNISHSRHLAAAAWGYQQLGLDIEYVSQKRDILGISEGFYGADEQKLIRQSGAAGTRLFHMCWTLKEAWLKLGGNGFADFATAPQFLPSADGQLEVIISKELNESPFKKSPGFCFQVWELESPAGETYYLALASQSAPDQAASEVVFDQNFHLPGVNLKLCCQSGYVRNPAHVD